MQQAALAAMAAHTILTVAANPTTPHQSLLFPTISSHSSSFYGVSLKTNTRPFFSLSTSAKAAPKPLTVVAATKKAVAVLKGASAVEGVVTLTQEDEGQLLFCLSVISTNSCCAIISVQFFNVNLSLILPIGHY